MRQSDKLHLTSHNHASLWQSVSVCLPTALNSDHLIYRQHHASQFAASNSDCDWSDCLDKHVTVRMLIVDHWYRSQLQLFSQLLSVQPISSSKILGAIIRKVLLDNHIKLMTNVNKYWWLVANKKFIWASSWRLRWLQEWPRWRRRLRRPSLTFIITTHSSSRSMMQLRQGAFEWRKRQDWLTTCVMGVVKPYMISGYSRSAFTTLKRILHGKFPNILRILWDNVLKQWCFQVGDKCWHSQCLRCSVCHMPLNSHSSCFLKYDQVLCKVDYIRLYGTKCSKCCHPITQSDWIRRAHDQVKTNNF